VGGGRPPCRPGGPEGRRSYPRVAQRGIERPNLSHWYS